MSGNKLLNENTIRRFMKLANVNALTNNFISEKYENPNNPDEDDDDEDTLPEGMYTRDDESDALREEEDELAPEDEMPEESPDEEMDMEMDMGGEEEGAIGAADISLTEEEARLLVDLGERLSAAMAEEVEEPMEDEPMEDEAAADEPLSDEPAEEDPAMGDRMFENHEDIVNEVLKRVTKRIVKQRRK